MRATVQDARELIAEGDRLMGQAWERAEAAKGAATDLDLALAEDCFERAAQAASQVRPAADWHGARSALAPGKERPGTPAPSVRRLADPPLVSHPPAPC